MRDHLIGYLLDALDPAEHQMVEAQLGRDPQLKRDLDLLAGSLLPLAADKEHFEPPLGLAQRTCEFVFAESKTTLPPPPVAVPSRWRLSDFAVAAGIFIAATLLFLPALNQSRFAMQVTQCQNNLRQIGMGLLDYSNAHLGYFPNVPLDGSAAAAGIYATRLIEHGYIPGAHVLVCPASALAQRGGVPHVPSRRELDSAHGARLLVLHEQMGGSYGYNLGYVANGKYQSTKNLSRVKFALMADVPQTTAPYPSMNHGGCGQNVLFEDGHVQYLTTCKAQNCNDDFFVNDSGDPAPGLHVNDAVVVRSEAKPQIGPTKSSPIPGLPR